MSLNEHTANPTTDRVQQFRAVLDSNAVDQLASHHEELLQRRANGTWDLMVTHVTVDELAAIPDLEHRCQMLNVTFSFARAIPTGALILGASRLGMARLSPEADDEVIERLRSRNLRHTDDALIGHTAYVEGAALVTADKRLTSAGRDVGLTVLAPSDVIDLLGATA